MIELTDEINQAIATAFADGVPLILGSADADGQPNITVRGTVQVYSDDALAFWARHRDGATVRGFATNPKVAVLYRNPAKRQGWTFFGRARVTDNPQDLELIYTRSPEREQQADPDRQGTGVIIELDRVLERGQVIMER